MLPRRWVTAGNGPLWRTEHGTYHEVAFADLPAIDRARHDGSFDWLAELPEVNGMIYGNDEDNLLEDDQVAERVETIVAAAEAEGLTVPPAFRAFFAEQNRTYRQIQSSTDCYLELGDRTTEIPGESGRFLRFMNDQQAVFVWGLHLRPDGSHQVVIARPEWIDGAEGPELEDHARFVDHAVCADDLEEFVHRFWLENAIWFGGKSGEMKAYAAEAQAAMGRRGQPG